MASKHKITGVYYYLNPDIAANEPIGKEGIDLDVQKKQEEGFGYVHAKDRAKDPKHIGGEHCSIKFQSARDLKKHGNTEKSKVSEAYEPLISGPGGDKLGRTPTDEKELRGMIIGMTPGQSILFHSQQGIRGPMIHITKLRGDSYEVEDQTKKKQTINRESQIDNLIDAVLKQVNVLSRVWIRTETPTYPKTPGTMPISKVQADNITKSEVKEVIKELIDEMWIGWEQEENKKKADKKKADVTEETDPNSQLVNTIKKIQSYASWGMKNIQKDPKELGIVFNRIIQEIDTLVRIQGFNYTKEGKRSAITIDAYARWGLNSLQSPPNKIINILQRISKETDILMKINDPSNIVRPLKEVEYEDSEYNEQQELLAMKRIQSYAHWGYQHAKSHPIEEIIGLFKKIVGDIDGLVKSHEHPTPVAEACKLHKRD